jgi:hypothetical protein
MAGCRGRSVVGFVSHSAVLDFEQAAVGAEVLTVVAGLVAVEQVEGAGVVGHGNESEGRGCGQAGFGLLGLVIFAHELAGHAGFFHHPDAGATPAGYDHHLDEFLFGGADGFVLIEEVLSVGFEGRGVFTGEEDDAAENAVLQAVAGGGKFALLRDGSTGFTAVGSGGFDLEV